MKVKIYKHLPCQNRVTDNGKWIMEFIGVKKDIEKNLFISKEMGWHGSNDMYPSEVKIEFPSLESAEKFAKINNFIFETEKIHKKQFKKKNYADNYKC